jgi:hypothetical protein
VDCVCDRVHVYSTIITCCVLFFVYVLVVSDGVGYASGFPRRFSFVASLC